MRPHTEFITDLLSGINAYIADNKKDLPSNPRQRPKNINDLRKMILTAAGYADEKVNSELPHDSYLNPYRLDSNYILEKPINNLELKSLIRTYIEKMESGIMPSMLKKRIMTVLNIKTYADENLKTLYINELEQYCRELEQNILPLRSIPRSPVVNTRPIGIPKPSSYVKTAESKNDSDPPTTTFFTPSSSLSTPDNNSIAELSDIEEATSTFVNESNKISTGTQATSEDNIIPAPRK